MAQRVRKNFNIPNDAQDAPIAPKRTGKRRGRRKMLVRLLIVAAVLLVVYLIAINWQSLAPGRFVSWVYDVFDGTTGGEWPATLTGDTVFDMGDANGNLVLATDSDIVYYNSHGGESLRRPCSYAKPLLRISDRYVLLLESGGTRFRLETRSGIELEQVVASKINTGAVSRSGDVAVVTDSTQSHVSQVTVFSRDGDKRYEWFSSEWLVMDVAFSGDGNSLAVIGSRAVGGAMQSAILVFDLRGREEQPIEYIGDQVLYTRVQYMRSGTVVAVGDAHVRFVNPTGSLDNTVSYKNVQLIGFAFASNDALIVTRPYGTQDGGTAAVYSSSGDKSFEQVLEGNFRDAAADGNDFLVLTDKRLYKLDDRALLDTASASPDSLMTGTVGDEELVLGLTQLVQAQWDSDTE